MIELGPEQFPGAGREGARGRFNLAEAGAGADRLRGPALECSLAAAPILPVSPAPR